jgi:hypothetical protein
MRILVGTICLALLIGGAHAADQQPSADQLAGAVRSHKVQDGSTVADVVAFTGRALRSVKWWADPSSSQAGFSYIDDPSQDPRHPHSVAWEVAADGTVSPYSDDARIIELGRLPFAYIVSLHNATTGSRLPFNPRLLRDPAVLAFLPSSDENLAQTFRRLRLTLRDLVIKWVVDPSAAATNGKLYYGYLVTVGFDCPGVDPRLNEGGQDTMQFIESNGVGGFTPFGSTAQSVVDGPGPKCGS